MKKKSYGYFYEIIYFHSFILYGISRFHPEANLHKTDYKVTFSLKMNSRAIFSRVTSSISRSMLIFNFWAYFWWKSNRCRQYCENNWITLIEKWMNN